MGLKNTTLFTTAWGDGDGAVLAKPPRRLKTTPWAHSYFDFYDVHSKQLLWRAAQRVEHYEIAAYGTVCAFAIELGQTEHESLLTETLEEEKETDEKLTELSQEINPQANESGEEGREEAGGKSKSKRAA